MSTHSGLLAGCVVPCPFSADVAYRPGATPVLIIDGTHCTVVRRATGSALRNKPVARGWSATHHALPVGHSISAEDEQVALGMAHVSSEVRLMTLREGPILFDGAQRPTLTNFVSRPLSGYVNWDNPAASANPSTVTRPAQLPVLRRASGIISSTSITSKAPAANPLIAPPTCDPATVASANPPRVDAAHTAVTGSPQPKHRTTGASGTDHVAGRAESPRGDSR